MKWMKNQPRASECDASRRRAYRVDGRMRVATRATMTLATSARVVARARPPRSPARGGTRTAAGVPDTSAGRDDDGDDGDGDGDDGRREGAPDVERAIRDDGETTPEYRGPREWSTERPNAPVFVTSATAVDSMKRAERRGVRERERERD